MNYKQRMLDEILYISEKIILLEKKDIVVEDRQKELLEQQLMAMRNYHCALYKRIMLLLEDNESGEITQGKCNEI